MLGEEALAAFAATLDRGRQPYVHARPAIRATERCQSGDDDFLWNSDVSLDENVCAGYVAKQSQAVSFLPLAFPHRFNGGSQTFPVSVQPSTVSQPSGAFN
jgi:hypothetical protein